MRVVLKVVLSVVFLAVSILVAAIAVEVAALKVHMVALHATSLKSSLTYVLVVSSLFPVWYGADLWPRKLVVALRAVLWGALVAFVAMPLNLMGANQPNAESYAMLSAVLFAGAPVVSLLAAWFSLHVGTTSERQ